MKCYNCKRVMEYKKGLRFNEYKIEGWKCKKCGEEYFDPVQAQRILILNKLKKQMYTVKLSRIKSNLIVRIPKEVSDVLFLSKESSLELNLDEKDRIVLKPISKKFK